jgi:hypothetical protein
MGIGRRVARSALLALPLSAAILSCAPLPTVDCAAVAPDYGYAESNPIKVGGAYEKRGPQNEGAYLSRLRGPAGQRLAIERRGSCCGFPLGRPTPMQKMMGMATGRGMLDAYNVTYAGLAGPVTLYLDEYRHEALCAPKGFRLLPAAE